MSRANKALVILAVAAMGLWGCAQGPTNGAGNWERIKVLETKVAKLEDDCRAVAAMRDQLRKKLTGVEEERTKLQQELDQLQAVLKERDELRSQLVARTTERDAVQGQFEQLRKGMRTLLGEREVPTAAPITTTTEVPASEKS